MMISWMNMLIYADSPNDRRVNQTQIRNQIQVHSVLGFPLLHFNRHSADEVAVRSLDQGFDSRLFFL